MIIVVDKLKAREVLAEIRQCEGCEDAEMIGQFVPTGRSPKVVMETDIGGRRIIGPLEGNMLPRIC